MGKSILDRGREILTVEQNGIGQMSLRLGSSFEDAVQLMVAAKGRVVVTGMGKSGLVGKKISATLSSVGTHSFFLHPAEAIHGDLGMLHKDDIIIAISNSGESEEVVRLLPIIKRFGLKMIALAGRKDSSLAKAADVFLDVGVAEEACGWDIVPTASTTATLAMGDALAIVAMETKGFQQDDFAKFHPGGSLGKGLIARVGDVMHAGEDMPLVNETATLAEAVAIITAKGMGMVMVRDAAGKLSGIITDGDLRRIFESTNNPMAGNVAEMMTKAVQTVTADLIGGAAVKMMEDKKITSLPVVDDANLPVGVVHLHDLLRVGVV